MTPGLQKLTCYYVLALQLARGWSQRATIAATVAHAPLALCALLAHAVGSAQAATAKHKTRVAAVCTAATEMLPCVPIADLQMTRLLSNDPTSEGRRLQQWLRLRRQPLLQRRQMQ